MSKCIINIKVGGESIEVEVDSSKLPTSLTELKTLFNKEKWEDLVNKIDSTLKNRKKINRPELKKIRESSHLIPNTTIGALMHMIPNPDPEDPTLHYPEDTEQFNISDKKILFVNSYKTEKGQLNYGLYKNRNGEEIIIVDRANLPSVIRYLQTMKAIKADHVLKNISPEIMGELRKILKEVKKEISEVSSVEEMLVNFLQNRNKYRSLIYTDNQGNNKSIKAYLDDIVGNIFNISSRKNYADVTVNNISHDVAWNKTFTTASISIDNLFQFLNNNLKAKMLETIKGAEGNINKVKELFINDQIPIEERDIIFNLQRSPGITTSSLQDLMEYVLSYEPEFNLQFKEVKNDRVYLEKYFPTLESQYKIGFDELKEYDEPIYYNGKYILQVEKNGKSSYFVTKHYTTEKAQWPRKFDSLQEAKNYIDNNIEEPIYKNSLIEFHIKDQNDDGTYFTDDHNRTIIKTPIKYDKGTLITIIDYDVPNVPLNLLSPLEAMFVSNQRFLNEEHPYATKEDFFTYLQEELALNEYSDDYINIVQTINTPEKIALFILGLNNPRTSQGTSFNKNSITAIRKLVKSIEKASENKKYYYVESSTGSTTKVIPVDNESKVAYKNNRKIPVIQLWEAASKVLSPKLGIDIEILLEPEKGKENAKAYIKNNKIYINIQKANSTDLFHEYVHLLMAYLKNNDNYRQRYLELLNNVWEKGNSLRKKEILENEIYANYSMIDKMEEFFAKEFGEWINNNAYNNYENIFANNGLIEEGSSIFVSDKSVKELYGSSIEEVFTSFNSDLARFFENNKPIMSDEFKVDFTKSRQKTEWIRQQLKEGKLEEYDC